MATIHNDIQPLSWLLGKWKSISAKAFYPTMKNDFFYFEELEFSHVGQPNIQYTSITFHAETKSPLHRELGFIKLQPGSNNVALVCVQNTGLAEVEEGTFSVNEIHLESRSINRLSFSKPPETRKIIRVFRLIDDVLYQKVAMETSSTSLTDHLEVKYKKA